MAVDELHAKRSRANQMDALISFAESDESVLFSTEMSAQRAADLRVTHVIEIGAPTDRTQHERRVAVATPGVGSALLLVEDYESEFAFEALGEETMNRMNLAKCYMGLDDNGLMERIHNAFSRAEWQLGAAGHMSFITFHSGRRKKYGWTRAQLVERASEWAKLSLNAGPWAVTSRMADRFRLWKIEGVEVDDNIMKEIAAMKDDLQVVDRSLDGIEPHAGIRGGNPRGKFVKEKKLKIGNWQDIMKSVKQDELKMLESLNQKSPEGRKYMALIAQKAIQRSLTPSKEESKRRKKEQSNVEKPRRKKRLRIRVESWAPKFADKRD